MGQGGYIVLVNRTSHVWTRTYIHSYQMNNWNFPEKINSGEVKQEYIEWDQGFFNNHNDDAGEVTFVLGNTGMTFQVQARVHEEFNLTVLLSNIHTPLGDKFDLGWIHDGTVKFYLIERNGQFSAPDLDTHWMTANLPLLGGRSLKNICMPGTHDSGMSERGADTAFAHDCNIITQTSNILGQLEYGARYFDIRPVISAGNYFTGHYGQILTESWQGGNGQSISSVIKQVNYFTTAYNELIILNFSHAYNTDTGNHSYTDFNQEEWNGLFVMLTGLSHLYITTSGPINVNLTDLPLNTYIGGRPAVIIVIEPECDLGEYAHKGFYKKVNYNVYNSYSNTDDLNTMMDDQIRKMKDQRPHPNANYFLLSWTLTQSSSQATFCYLDDEDSILTLANKANSVSQQVLNHCTPQTYPNIFFIDNIANTDVTDLSMQINLQAAP